MLEEGVERERELKLRVQEWRASNIVKFLYVLESHVPN